MLSIALTLTFSLSVGAVGASLGFLIVKPSWMNFAMSAIIIVDSLTLAYMWSECSE